MHPTAETSLLEVRGGLRRVIGNVRPLDLDGGVVGNCLRGRVTQR